MNDVALARLSDPDAVASLAEIDSDLIASGRLSLIGLEAVRDRLGPRWARRREQVWETAEAYVRRSLGPGDLFQRVSETEFVVGFTDSSPPVARGRALQILTSILTYFLGRSEPADLRVGTVTGIENGALKARMIPEGELGALLRAAETEVVAVPVQDAAPVPERPRLTWRRSPIRLASGTELGLALWSEPVTHAASQSRAGLRIGRRILSLAGRPLTAAERERLQPVEQAELDIATLRFAREAIAEEADQGLNLLPLSFAAFANPTARLRYSTALGELPAGDRARLVLEVEDLAMGTPPGRIGETVSYMRPYCRAVVVRTAPIRAALEAMRGAHIRGLSLDAEALEGRPGEVFGRLKLLRERSQGIAPEVLALGLGAPDLTPVAVAAGASFYSVRPDAEAKAMGH